MKFFLFFTFCWQMARAQAPAYLEHSGRWVVSSSQSSQTVEMILLPSCNNAIATWDGKHKTWQFLVGDLLVLQNFAFATGLISGSILRKSPKLFEGKITDDKERSYQIKIRFAASDQFWQSQGAWIGFDIQPRNDGQDLLTEDLQQKRVKGHAISGSAWSTQMVCYSFESEFFGQQATVTQVNLGLVPSKVSLLVPMRDQNARPRPAVIEGQTIISESADGTDIILDKEGASLRIRSALDGE